MDPERLADWQAADALFDQWLDLPEPERDAWLAAQAPSGAVRRRLDQLIDAHRRPRAALDPSGDNLAGCRLGEWTLGSELGRGGMAVVYRAWREDGMARRQAALKILTLGALGATGRERFQREAEILARLNHPNITPLIDSGVAGDGTCWLAMPLVEGKRIDAWCDTQALDARSIVRLYLQVCGAVACAHRNLVIHRDIKPSNVLVEEAGHVRLLDFGIGQFTDAAAEPTQTLWRAMTPGYAAPEQLRGDPPSTAIDVYGLGALLHRLLTGLTPEAGDTTTRPSQLVRTSSHAYHRHYLPLRNDLDRVLLKALAEEPERRYASVEAFADDLRRWLDQRPVLAQEPSLGYRARKFIGRNRFGVAAGVLLALSLAGGAAATLWQAGEAREQAALAAEQARLAQQEAEAASLRAHRAEAVRDFLGNMFITTRGSDGGSPRVTEVMEATARGARGEHLAKEPLTAADILLLTGAVRFNLDDYEGSRADLEDALELLTPHQQTSAGEMSRVHWELARHAKHSGDPEGMLAHAREAVELNTRWNAPPNESLRARITLAEALLQSDPAAAEEAFRALVAEIEAGELKDSIRHINALNGLSIALARPGHDPAARLPIQEERIRIARLIYGPEGGGLAFTLGDATHTYRMLGMFDQAEALAREAMAIADRSLQRPLMLRGMSRCALGLVLQQRGRQDEAWEVLGESTRILREAGDNSLGSDRCWYGLAYAAAATARYPQALAALARSDEMLTANDRGQHADAFRNCGLRASVQLRQGQTATAGRTLSACPPPDLAAAPLAYLQARAESLFATGERAEAGRLLEELRGLHAPDTVGREWARPWMLSALHAAGVDPSAANAALASGLGEHAAMEPLSHCLAAPDEARCLAFP